MFGDNWVCFTTDLETLQKVRTFSNCTILLSIKDGTAEETIQASIFPHEWEKAAISNGITYLLTDRILPTRNWKKIRTRH